MRRLNRALSRSTQRGDTWRGSGQRGYKCILPLRWVWRIRDSGVSLNVGRKKRADVGRRTWSQETSTPQIGTGWEALLRRGAGFAGQA